MGRYYFDLKSDERLIVDNEGVEAFQFIEALTQAHEVIDSMLTEDPDAFSGDWDLHMRDSSGVVAILPIRLHAPDIRAAGQSENDPAQAMQRVLARFPSAGRS